MEISKITLKQYLLFYKSVYKDDTNFKDNKTGIAEIVCGKNRPFYGNSKQEIIAVKEEGRTLCACVLIVHKNAIKLLSMAFFEALTNCKDAVKLLVEYAENFGKQHDCAQLIVSLDGHINNNVAFPFSQSKPSFGESYCHEYYHKYFEDFKKIKFTSFYDQSDLVKSRIDDDLLKFEKFKDNIVLEHANFNGRFKETMHRYTDLNNEIFADHNYYFPREYQEDYDLFSDMRPLLKNENLIFAKRDGRDIGFILWYPDFNEFVGIGKSASASTFLKYKVLKQNPKTVKVVEIGVLTKYRRFGTILLLFNAAIKMTSKNTRKVLSSWILDENAKSKAITQRYTKKQYKDYFAYEKEL